jgi:hypothetical protein
VQLISRWLRYGRHSRPLAGSMADQGEISGGTSCRSSMRQTDKLSNTHSLMMTISVPSELACLALLGSVQLSSWRCLPWLSLRHRAQLTDRGFQFVGRNRSRVVISFGFQRECVSGGLHNNLLLGSYGKLHTLILLRSKVALPNCKEEPLSASS